MLGMNGWYLTFGTSFLYKTCILLKSKFCQQSGPNVGIKFLTFGGGVGRVTIHLTYNVYNALVKLHQHVKTTNVGLCPCSCVCV